jgi:hypothetical protein
VILGVERNEGGLCGGNHYKVTYGHFPILILIFLIYWAVFVVGGSSMERYCIFHYMCECGHDGSRTPF